MLASRQEAVKSLHDVPGLREMKAYRVQIIGDDNGFLLH